MQYAKSFTDGLQFLWGEGYLSPGGPEEIAAILTGMDLSGRRVLDFGSGLGGIDCLLATRFGAAQVIGIDVEPELVAAATSLAEGKGLSDRVQFQTVLPGALPFANATFDLVFSKDAMVHVADKRALYREIVRVLRPGGSFRAGDWLWANRAESHPDVMAWLGSGPLHFAFTTPVEAEAALVEAGLQDVSVTDKRADLQRSNRGLISRLNGPDFGLLRDLVGEEQALARLNGTLGRQAALDAGQLIPCHMSANRAV